MCVPSLLPGGHLSFPRPPPLSPQWKETGWVTGEGSLSQWLKKKAGGAGWEGGGGGELGLAGGQRGGGGGGGSGEGERGADWSGPEQARGRHQIGDTAVAVHDPVGAGRGWGNCQPIASGPWPDLGLADEPWM